VQYHVVCQCVLGGILVCTSLLVFVLVPDNCIFILITEYHILTPVKPQIGGFRFWREARNLLKPPNRGVSDPNGDRIVVFWVMGLLIAKMANGTNEKAFVGVVAATYSNMIPSQLILHPRSPHEHSPSVVPTVL
jgi:hypothetical protein